MKTILLLTALLSLVAIGCATKPRPLPIAPEEIISMSKAGLSDQEIIHRIQVTHSVYRLTSADVVRLRNAGVSDPVVNYMLDTYVRYSQYLQQRQDYYDSDWHWGVGFWYGGPYYRRW